MARAGHHLRSWQLFAAASLMAVAASLVLVARSSWYRQYRLGRMNEAALRDWTERKPDDALGHFYLGLVRGRSGDVREGARQLEKALELDPTLVQARWRLARVLAATGQPDAAESMLREGLRLEPSAARLHAEMGRLYEGRRAYRLAAGEWEKATSLDPKDAEAWYQLGLARMGVNDETRALAAYRRAADLAPRSATYQKALAGVLRVKRQYEDAERHCRRALELAPNDPDAHFGLAKLLWDRDGATPQAETSMRRAVSLQPESPLLHYSLASLEQERSAPEAAAREYREALRLLGTREPPPAPGGWDERERWLSQLEGPLFNLAQVLQRLGHSEEAARHLARFRRISDYRNRVRQALVRIANRPGDAALHFELARVHASAGSPELAAEEYQAGLRQHADARAETELRAVRGQRKR
jgi:tetratricopeptide (TPR) repeat protein